MGIEPTTDIFLPVTGFEVQRAHQDSSIPAYIIALPACGCKRFRRYAATCHLLPEGEPAQSASLFAGQPKPWHPFPEG